MPITVRVIGEKQNCLELHLEDQEEEALPLVPVLLPARNVITGYTAQIANAMWMDCA